MACVRRRIARAGGWLATCLLLTGLWHTAHAEEVSVEADLLVVGGTESGCAAAIQAARMGIESIVLVNDIEWLGGQFSAEGLVAIDESTDRTGERHERPFPRAGLFREITGRIEDRNLQRCGVRRPGNTRVLTTCRPADAEAVFRELLQPYVRNGQVSLYSNYQPVATSAGANGKRLREVLFHATDGGKPLRVSARLTIDASDWGDVIRLAGAGFEFGPDLRDKYDEPLAPVSRSDYPVTDMNPITYCMVLVETDTYRPIPRPPRYDPRHYLEHDYPQDPLWLYASRRIVDSYGFPEIEHPDVVLLCFPAFDYPLDVLPAHVAAALEANEVGSSGRNIVEMTPDQRAMVFEDAKQYALGFLYYLQTHVHDGMEDPTHSFRRFVLTDEFGTADRMPFKPYVRESLRLRAMYMMRQQDTTGHANRSSHYGTAMYHDGIAAWQFEYDFHPTRRRFLDGGDPAGPWTPAFRPGRTWGPPFSGRCLFPARSLIPEHVDGLLGAQKNLGFSSLVSAAVRLHDHSVAVGQACGALAAVSLSESVEPREIPFDARRLGLVWRGLAHDQGEGQPQMLWPFADLRSDDPAFVAANQLAIRRILPLRADEVEFRGNEPAGGDWRNEIVRRSHHLMELPPDLEPAAGTTTRSAFVREWWTRVSAYPERAYPPGPSGDRDEDGIRDADDPLPLTAAESSWPPTPRPPDADGHPPTVKAGESESGETVVPVAIVNFTGRGQPAGDGFQIDDGTVFGEERGFGWSRDVSMNFRVRRMLAEPWRDSFHFTRATDRWEYRLPKGRYRVTVCIGDAGHPQPGQRVNVEGTAVFVDHTTEAGWFSERTVDVDVADGRLTLDIGRPEGGANTCVNWLRVGRLQLELP